MILKKLEKWNLAHSFLIIFHSSQSFLHDEVYSSNLTFSWRKLCERWKINEEAMCDLQVELQLSLTLKLANDKNVSRCNIK